MGNPNTLEWDGGPGHYEVYYLTTTDPATGTGLWIRYTMRSPSQGEGECSLWFLAMTPGGDRFARKVTLPIDRLVAEPDPFRLAVGDAVLSDTGMSGALDEVAWDLTWTPRLPAYQPVHPMLRRAKLAKTVFVLPHADLRVAGTVSFDGRTLALDGAKGGQAHLFGSKHANRWTWTHCNDFTGADGAPHDDTFFEGVSVFVPRLGREIGPSTPIVARVAGDDFLATGPLDITRTSSAFGLTTWRCEAVSGKRKLVAEVDAPRASLVGVTYHDPDGENAYCYNSEVASMRLHVWDKTARGRFGWALRETLVSDGRAHFEYAQRSPIDGLELLTT
jgi:hypothetical protein